MSRIFLSLALFAVVLLVSNIVLGLALGDVGATSHRYEQARQQAHDLEMSNGTSNAEVLEARAKKDEQLAALGRMRSGFQPHIWLGIVAALVTVLVNCISVTYFIGTSRWCREVVDAYGLDDQLAQRSRALKRRSFPFAFIGMLTTLAIVALGAASDPGASLASPASWVMPHMFAAMLGTCVIAVAFYFQAMAISSNYEVINQILVEAERLRKISRSETDADGFAVAAVAPDEIAQNS